MIGVNNRDLETLVIDPGTADRIIPSIPADVVAIAESGVTTRADVERYAESAPTRCSSARAFLPPQIPSRPTRSLAGVPKVSRAS